VRFKQRDGLVNLGRKNVWGEESYEYRIGLIDETSGSKQDNFFFGI